MSQLLLFLAYFLIPLGEIFRIDLTSGVVILPLDILAGINLLYVLHVFIKTKQKPSSPIIKSMFIFTGVAIASLLVNTFFFSFQEVGVGSLYLLRWIGFASFFVTAASNANKEKNLYYLLTSGLVFGLFGIAQFFLYPNLRNLYYAGWDEHYYRLFSTFLDPNFAGIFLVLTFLLSFFLLITQNLTKYARFALAIANFFLLICIFLTFSRSAFLSLFSGLLVFAIFLEKSRKYVFFGLGLSILGVIIIVLNSQFNEGTKLFRAASSLARIESLHDSWTIFTKNPIFGTGFNLYRYASHKYGLASGPNWQTSHSGAGVENSFAFVLATAGIIGFIAYTYLFYTIFKHTIKNNSRKSLIYASLTACIVSSFFVNSLFFPAVMLWIWITLGLTESKKL